MDDTTNKEQPSDGAVSESAEEKKEQKKTTGRKKKFAFTLLAGRGQAHIHATYNNTIVSVADSRGNVITWSSAGKCGFKGAKKSTPYAAGVIVKSMIDKVKQEGVREVDVYLQGVGAGREAAIRSFVMNGIHIMSIKDQTGTPHNGPRRPKPRRI